MEAQPARLAKRAEWDDRPFLVLAAKGKWVVIRQGSAVPVTEHVFKVEAVREAKALARMYRVKLQVFDVGVGDLPGDTPRD
jgi:hypothetical protein